MYENAVKDPRDAHSTAYVFHIQTLGTISRSHKCTTGSETRQFVIYCHGWVCLLGLEIGENSQLQPWTELDFVGLSVGRLGTFVQCGANWVEDILGGGWRVSVRMKMAKGAGVDRRNGFLVNDE